MLDKTKMTKTTIVGVVCERYMRDKTVLFINTVHHFP